MYLSEIELVEGRFLNEGKNRFICKVLVGNEICECYVPSSSRLESFINLKNKRVLLSINQGKSTRTKFSLFAVTYHKKLIVLNLNMVNKLVEVSIREGKYEKHLENNSIIRETQICGYKADLLLEGLNTIIIENKAIISTTKEALFPTIYSERAISQLKKLEQLLAIGYKVHYNFISLSPFVKSIKLNKQQIEYYEHFVRCINKEMKVNAYCLYFENNKLESSRIEVQF